MANHNDPMENEKRQSTQNLPAKGKVLRLGILPMCLALLLGVGYWVETSRTGKEFLKKIAGGPPDGYEVPLVDSHGNTLSLSGLRGKWVVLIFGFVSCPDICPTHLAYLSREIRRLNTEAATKPPQNDPLFQGVFVSVDPQRDTLPNLESFRMHFDKGHGEILALTGSEKNLRSLAKSYGAFFEYRTEARAPLDSQSAPSLKEGYDVAHSTGFYLIDPSGYLAGVVSPPLAQGQLVDQVNRAQRKF